MFNQLKEELNSNFKDFEQEIAELNKISENYHKLLESLKASEAKYRFITENSADIIFQLDKDYKIVYVNPADEKQRGYKKEEVIGKNIWEFVEPNIRDQVYKMIAYKKENRIPFTEHACYQAPTLHKDGYYIWFEVNINPILDLDNNITGYNAIARDITLRKKYEEEIQIKNKELKELNEAKDKFFSIIAHDLRSPYQGLMGVVNILLNEYDTMPRETAKDYLGLLNRSVKAQYNLLEDLLSWSKIQSGKMKCIPRKINLLDGINSAISNLVPNARNKGINVEVNINKYLSVSADPDMFNLLVRNLFSNAIKFTGNNGKIEILTGNLSNEIYVEIKDSGIGIEKENIDKLFRMDVSFSMPGTNSEKGSGLGLLLCKEILDKHNGKIWVESKFGKGSSFKFIFPKDENN